MFFINSSKINIQNNKPPEVIDSTAIIIIDTVNIQGYLVYYYNHKTKKSFYSRICFFVFLDSNNLVLNPNDIKREFGYNYMDKGQLSALAKEYKYYEKRLHPNQLTFKSEFPQKFDSINPNPIKLLKEVNLKRGSYDLKIYKLKHGKYIRFNVSYELLKKVFTLYEVPHSLISEKGWVSVLVPL